jgi:hypothetical protein
MQSLKDEHAGGFVPDEKWYKNFIAKAIVFRSTQDIVKKQKFRAYQAIISAYTIACLAQRFGDVFDFDLVWSRQAISSELKAMIQNWTVMIDKSLRQSADKRMPSEWAKRIECWDSLRETELETPDYCRRNCNFEFPWMLLMNRKIRSRVKHSVWIEILTA